MIVTIIKFFSGVLLLYLLSIFTGSTIAIIVGFLAAITYIYIDLKKIKKMTNSTDFINLDHPKDCPCSDCEIKFEPPDHEEPPHY